MSGCHSSVWLKVSITLVLQLWAGVRVQISKGICERCCWCSIQIPFPAAGATSFCTNRRMPLVLCLLALPFLEISEKLCTSPPPGGSQEPATPEWQECKMPGTLPQDPTNYGAVYTPELSMGSGWARLLLKPRLCLPFLPALSCIPHSLLGFSWAHSLNKSRGQETPSQALLGNPPYVLISFTFSICLTTWRLT